MRREVMLSKFGEKERCVRISTNVLNLTNLNSHKQYSSNQTYGFFCRLILFSIRIPSVAIICTNTYIDYDRFTIHLDGIVRFSFWLFVS